MKVRVIPNGVDTNKFKPINRKKAVEWFEGKFYELDDDLNIVYVGRFSEEKGVEYLIKSLQYLDEGKLFLVGGGPQEIKLKKLAERFTNRVHFLGRVSHEEIPLIHNAMDVFVLPSVSMEGFSNSMLEALACGLPVVATPIGAAPEIINNKLGTIVNVGDSRAIAEGVNNVRDLDRKRIHVFARSKHSFEVIADKVYSLYSKITGYPPESIGFASLFAPPYELSGVGMQVFQLSKSLAKRCSVTIICGVGGEGNIDGVRLVRVKSPDGLFSRPFYSLSAILKINVRFQDFDLIDGRNWEGGLISLAAKKKGCKAVMSLRGEGAIGEATWKRTLNKFIMQRMDCVTATDSKTAKKAEELLT